jgi:VanZ family protein
VKESRLRHELLYGMPVLAYAGLIFFLSSIPKFPDFLPTFSGFDKIVHFGEYFLLGWLLCRWLSAEESPWVKRRALSLTLALGILYGISDEWHQSFVPGRDASFWDAAIDALAVGAAVFCYPRVARQAALLKFHL